MADNQIVIDVEHLTKAFNQTKVVDDVSLQVNRGDVYGFLGPNGSGKTTTIRMICGLLSIDGGQGTCLGYDIQREAEAIKNKVGYMPQKFSLYNNLTVYQNLLFFAQLHGLPNPKTHVEKVIDQLKIGHKRASQLAGQLSGGWKQRLSLGVATIHDPELLLLDEPTAGVDPKARREFWAEIFRLSDTGVTTLVSTHYMDEAERCGKLAYIVYGHLLTKGTPQEIIAQSNLSTYRITGDNLPKIEQDLKREAAVDQTAMFGKNLHVSSVNGTQLKKVLSNYQDYNITPIPPSLEDVFIFLMRHHEDNFA